MRKWNGGDKKQKKEGRSRMNDERGEETRIRQEIWRMGQENEEIRETKRIGRPEGQNVEKRKIGLNV